MNFIEQLKNKLVDDANTLWKRWSVRIQASVLILAPAWALAPAQWTEAVPKWVYMVLMALFAFATISAQAVKQVSLQPPNDGKDAG